MNQLFEKTNIKDIKKLISYLKSELFSLYGLYPKIGLELEFYLVSHGGDLDVAVENIEKTCTKLAKERGCNQYEAIIEFTDDIDQLLSFFEFLKSTILVQSRKNDVTPKFDPLPFEDDYGSAMHFHLSLHDRNLVNVFSLKSIEENTYLDYVMAGILDISPSSLYLLSSKDDDFKRLNKAGFLAPSHISWGGNNRTTIIRIPDSKPQNRRVEFRLPHANSDPAISIAILLIGALHGLKNSLECPERIFGNAYDENYKLEKLPTTMEEAKIQFEKNGKIKHYISEFKIKENSDE